MVSGGENGTIVWLRSALALGAILVSSSMIGSSGVRADGVPEELGGRPFSDPAQVMPMSSEWLSRPVIPGTGAPVDLALALDQQLYPALEPLIRDFARERTKKIAVRNGTCGISGGALADKTADIAGFCCPPGVTDRLPGLRFHTLAIGALALITHPDNPLDDISLGDARAIFAGRHRDWSDLPPSGIKRAPSGPTVAVTRLHCKARAGHWRLILDDQDDFGDSVREVGAIKDMILQVARYPGTIGYETLWHVERLADAGKVKILRIDGVDPRDDAAVAAGRYPLYRVFNLTTWEDAPAANPLAGELVAELAAAEVPAFYHFVPSAKLREAGWAFRGQELIGPPARAGY